MSDKIFVVPNIIMFLLVIYRLIQLDHLQTKMENSINEYEQEMNNNGNNIHRKG